MTSFTFVLVATSLLVATSRGAPKNSKEGIQLPDGCRGKGFCSIRPKGYDEIEAKINGLLPPYMNDVGSRNGNDDHNGSRSDDKDNCPSVTTWESVYAFEHPTGTKVDIIVQTKMFPQKLTKVNCKHSKSDNQRLKEGASQCFSKLGLDDFNLKFSCQESTATRTLLVYDPEVHSLKMKNYTIPVCCSCQIKKD